MSAQSESRATVVADIIKDNWPGDRNTTRSGHDIEAYYYRIFGELRDRWSKALDDGCPHCGPLSDGMPCDHVEGYHFALSELSEVLDGPQPIHFITDIGGMLHAVPNINVGLLADKDWDKVTCEICLGGRVVYEATQRSRAYQEGRTRE